MNNSCVFTIFFGGGPMEFFLTILLVNVHTLSLEKTCGCAYIYLLCQCIADIDAFFIFKTIQYLVFVYFSTVAPRFLRLLVLHI